jgi:hypothetical protein
MKGLSLHRSLSTVHSFKCVINYMLMKGLSLHCSLSTVQSHCCGHFGRLFRPRCQGVYDCPRHAPGTLCQVWICVGLARAMYIRYNWQENHQMYGHKRCIYTVMANARYVSPLHIHAHFLQTPHVVILAVCFCLFVSVTHTCLSCLLLSLLSAPASSVCAPVSDLRLSLLSAAVSPVFSCPCLLLSVLSAPASVCSCLCLLLPLLSVLLSVKYACLSCLLLSVIYACLLSAPVSDSRLPSDSRLLPNEVTHA